MYVFLIPGVILFFGQASKGSGLRMYDIEEMGPNMQMDRLAVGLQGRFRVQGLGLRV